jgi:hypothetical protein
MPEYHVTLTVCLTQQHFVILNTYTYRLHCVFPQTPLPFIKSSGRTGTCCVSNAWLGYHEEAGAVFVSKQRTFPLISNPTLKGFPPPHEEALAAIFSGVKAARGILKHLRLAMS